MHKGHGVLQGGCLAWLSACAMKGSDSSWILLHKAVDDLARVIGGAVIDRNNGQLVRGIIHLKQGGQNVGHHCFFIVRGDQYRYRGPDSRIDINVRMSLFTRKAVQSEAVMPYGVDTDKRDYDAEQVEQHMPFVTYGYGYCVCL